MFLCGFPCCPSCADQLPGTQTTGKVTLITSCTISEIFGEPPAAFPTLHLHMVRGSPRLLHHCGISSSPQSLPSTGYRIMEQSVLEGTLNPIQSSAWWDPDHFLGEGSCICAVGVGGDPRGCPGGQCWAGLPWQGGQADCPQLMGLVDTHGDGSYLCMSTISPASGGQRIMECFGLEWTLKPILCHPWCCHTCIHRHTPAWAIMGFYLTGAQPLEASLGVSSDIIGQAHSGHVQNPAVRGAVCLGQPGGVPAEPQGVVCPISLPKRPLATLHPPGTCTSHRECCIPSTPNIPHSPQTPASALTKESCGSPCWIRPKVSKTKITNIK